jgi:hypothetical protein
MTERLSRTKDFGFDMNEVLDEIYGILNDIGLSGPGSGGISGSLPPPSPSPGSVVPVGPSPSLPGGGQPTGTSRLVNNSTNPLTAGSLAGFDADGFMAKAIAASTVIRPSFLVLSNASPGIPFGAAFIGPHPVNVEFGVSPSRGDPAFLSQTDAGRVTNTRQSSGKVFLVGQFVSLLDPASNKADVMLIPNIEYTTVA